jgi:hypothetical protein
VQSGRRSAWRRGGQRSGAVRIALQLAVPVALGLALGLVLAFQAGSSNGGPAPAALGAPVRPSLAASAVAQLGSPQTTTAADRDCDLIVPADPLSARGLATPYQLTGVDGRTPAESGCRMSNAAKLGAFVQATILNPVTGALSVYDPLVVTAGTRPAVKPTIPPIPANAVVTIDFGFNGKELFPVGATPETLAQAGCVTGQPGSAFGQVAFCNGVKFFDAVRTAEREKRLRVPSPGTSGKIIPSGGGIGTGRVCPVTRNFEVAADQPSANNVTTEYLLNPLTGQTAQDTTSNAGNIAGATLLFSRSDNTLLDQFLDPVLGCTPFQAPDLANNDQPTSSQALDEILAGAYQPQVAALVPENDEMVRGPGGAFDAAKTDLYREELGQAPIRGSSDETSDPRTYCQNIVDIQTPFLAANRALLATGQSPATATGDNLLSFMAVRLNLSFANLGCQRFGLANPVTVTRNAAGVAIGATFNTTSQRATAAVEAS